MSERDEPQLSFRVKERAQKEEFTAALDKQKHIPSAAALFISVMEAVKAASDEGRLIEWPVELVLKPKK